MELVLNIHYATQYGQLLGVQIFDNNKHIVTQTVICNTEDGKHWQAIITIPEGVELYYRYQIISAESVLSEFGDLRSVGYRNGIKHIYAYDSWRSPQWNKNIFLSNAFTKVYCARPQVKPKNTTQQKSNTIRFQLREPLVDKSETVGVIGNIDQLGSWKKPVIMDHTNYPLWQVDVPLASELASIQYKYVIVDVESGHIKRWEDGENRAKYFHLPEIIGHQLCITDEWFRGGNYGWKAAGMAIPIFSLRSHKGMGIGEYLDLLPMIDICYNSGMKILQTLPVNDTIATKTWTDSYPYAAISVYALHPQYINVDAISPWMHKDDQEAYQSICQRLNALPSVDFEAVLHAKMNFFKIKFYETFSDMREDRKYKDFIRNNRSWIYSYAAFCHLRDNYDTPQFINWPKHSTYNEDAILEFFRPEHPNYTDVHFYIWLQYHAHAQIAKAKAYGRSKGVILKGDLPIGIYRHSADAWVAPELYNMAEQAGAPPDDYAEDGQNWGFPTYNWHQMAKNNFTWWKSRMAKLEEHFDALRIDHILGFFRIWQIPIDQVSGVLGLFNPRLPYTLEDLSRMGLKGDVRRYSKPYIRHHMLEQRFGSEMDYVISSFLEPVFDGAYQFIEAYDTQQKIQQDEAIPTYLKKNLMGLVSEVLLIEEPNSNGHAFNPRITLHKTQSFEELSQEEKRIFENLYHDYYYQRHESFWKEQALWKLPEIVSATNMLICGEDLGMIPSTVPQVMEQLNILSLEIQRMPKGHDQFGKTEYYPYESVCSPSCHDMSTIRGWWEENSNIRQAFHDHWLYRIGSAPEICTSDIVTQVNLQHLQSPSMLAIFPIQDILGMFDTLKRKEAAEEQINQPSNPKHYWRYRLHLPLEDLLGKPEWQNTVKSMVVQTGR